MGSSFAWHLARYGPAATYPTPDLAAARSYCARFTRSQYENFTVASALLPRRLVPHFYPVYAYCRWADNLADETGGGETALRLLAWWREELLHCYAGETRHPVMVALLPTIRRFNIPAQPFLDLLIAFERDQHVQSYAAFDDLLNYCRYSANPVGRLVLYLCESFDEHRAELSDHICTGLQLANFWQDVARDYRGLGRVYLPEQDRKDFGYDHQDLMAGRCTKEFQQLMRFQVDRTRAIFAQGRPLLELLPNDIRVDIELFLEGGLAILRNIEAIEYDVWSQRPKVSKREKLGLLWRAVRRKVFVQSGAFAAIRPNSGDNRLRESYHWCRRLTRKTARNFGYSFLVLPRAKRRAMDALYAYMRITDDIADEAGTPDSKRTALALWRANLLEALEGVYRHPLHPALHDIVKRYRIPVEYLLAVIDGVESDIEWVELKTFEQLETYCYRVASVVGLCCIHIWGFHGASAKEYAIANGIALQLTNILRDLGEDQRNGRIYLPREDLERFACFPENWHVDSPAFQALMQFQTERIQTYYAKGAQLASCLTSEGRAVFRAMTGIYRELLDTIVAKHYHILHERVKVSRRRKIRWLLSAFPIRWGWR